MKLALFGTLAFVTCALAAFAVYTGILTTPLPHSTLQEPAPPVSYAYAYPSPSYWPLTEYPMGSPKPYAAPQLTISPCPSYAPTLINRGSYYECVGKPLPNDPHTGPICAPPSVTPYSCVEDKKP